MISRPEIEKGRNKFHIVAKDSFLIREAINQIGSVVPEYEIKIFYDLSGFSECCHRGMLFESFPKIIVLWDVTAEMLGTILEIVRFSIKDILVFIELKALPKNKAYTEIKAECVPVVLKAPEDREAVLWVSDRMRKMGLDFSSNVPAFLVEKRGTSLGILDREIRKLKIFCSGKRIEINDLNNVPDTRDAVVYKFSEDFLHRRYERAFNQLNKFDASMYVKVVFTLVDHLTRLLKILSLKEVCKDDDEVAGLSGLNKFILKTKYYTILSVMGRNKIIKMMDHFNELDYMIRKSPISKELVMSSYLVKASKI
jgi:DNA polymerase III delta subunit